MRIGEVNTGRVAISTPAIGFTGHSMSSLSCGVFKMAPCVPLGPNFAVDGAKQGFAMTRGCSLSFWGACSGHQYFYFGQFRGRKRCFEGCNSAEGCICGRRLIQCALTGRLGRLP